jgi:hypothetical protein
MTDVASEDIDQYKERVDIHDREFQKYSIENRIYYVPVDEVRVSRRPPALPSAELWATGFSSRIVLIAVQEEEDRLDVHHQMLQDLFDGRMFFPPIQYPRRILDCGYGQGHWAVQMAGTYDASRVILSSQDSFSSTRLFGSSNGLTIATVFLQPRIEDVLNSITSRSVCGKSG